MRAWFVSVPLLGALSVAALAQPASTATTTPKPNSVSIEPDQLPSEYLHIARNALVLDRTRQVQEALEMAQTRMLDRSVPIGKTSNPSENVTSQQISQARQALAARDRAGCMDLIEAAISSAIAQGF